MMTSKVIIIVRTLNEERNIERFCFKYMWAHKILIADGGSEDDTLNVIKHIQERQSNVCIRPYSERTYINNGLWRNPAGEHIMFLVDWANLYHPDWIVFDDCDSIPNSHLIEQRQTLFNSPTDAILVRRLYLWGNDHYFSKMSDNLPGCLWAWRPRSKIRFLTNSENYTHEMFPKLHLITTQTAEFPAFLMHYFYPTEEIMEKKLRWYRDLGEHPHDNPKKHYGDPIPLPEEWK